MDANKNLTFPIKLLPLLESKDNAVICPYGIETVLAMVAEGACEEALMQILYVLGFENLEELRNAVLSVQDMRCSAFTSDNSLDLQKGEEKLELLSNFRQVMEEHYNASISEAASEGKATLSLKNLANFKAEWLYKMERDDNPSVERFHNADGSIASPAFLSAEREFLRYYEDDFTNGRCAEVKAVALPYKLKGEPIPYELVLVNTKEALTEDTLKNILGNMHLGECKVVFPEFSIKNKYNLVPVMQCLGLNAIFNEHFEGLDKMATKPLYANKFSQEAEIEVDKNGTVAKAVTSMECCHLGDFIDFGEELIFDKPFHYFLRNTTTGKIIFMGKVNKLENCERTTPVEVPEFLLRMFK